MTATTKPESDLLLSLVPADGTFKGNVTLQRELAEIAEGGGLPVDGPRYWVVRNELIQRGLLQVGRGRGGSVARVLSSSSPEAGLDEVAQLVAETEATAIAERDLYVPFAKGLHEYWVPDNLLEDVVVQVTAYQGRRYTGGDWTRPDVVLVSVEHLPLIPGAQLEVVTFELKPNADFSVKGLFEAAAHSVASHKSYVAVHVSDVSEDNEAVDRMIAECRRFNIGLITFVEADDGATWNVLYEPERRSPDPREVSRFLTRQLTEQNQKVLGELLFK